MARKKPIEPGKKVGLKLTKAERALLLERLVLIPTEVEDLNDSTPPSEAVMISLDDLDDLAGHVAAEANHTKDKEIQKTLDRISKKIEVLLDRYTDEAEPLGGNIRLVEYLAQSHAGNPPTIPPRSSKTKRGGEPYPLRLTDKQREALVHATRLRRGLKNKIDQAPGGTQIVGFTKKELDEMAEEVETSLEFAPHPFKKPLVAVRDTIDDLLDALKEDEPVKLSRKPVPKADRIYQFKITLKDISPPIWRRIQMPDCTLGDLHEVIQTVMGWKDCHLHRFIVNGEYYGPPEPDGLDFDWETEDEEGVLLGKITKGNRKVRFRYDYDFLAGWQHEIVIEHVVEREPKVKYPRCVEGARACPPENLGGPSGYDEFLEAIADPKHEDHEVMKEWIGDKFDPERFDVKKVNRGLRRLWPVLFPPETTP